MKKRYIKPEVIKIELDNKISLVMMTWKPGDGRPPWTPGKPPVIPPPKPKRPFESPFEDRPFY